MQGTSRVARYCASIDATPYLDTERPSNQTPKNREPHTGYALLRLVSYIPNTSFKALHCSLARTLCRRLGVSECPVDVVGGDGLSLSSRSSSSQYSARLTSSLLDGVDGNTTSLGAARWHS